MDPLTIIFQLALRIVGVIVCYYKAKELNRSKEGWGFFGFVAPFIAMIWVQFMKPIIVMDDDVDLNEPTENKE